MKIATAAKRRPAWQRFLVRALAYPLAAYLLLVVLKLLFENYLVYFPVSAESYWIDPPELSKQDLTLTLADGAPIHAWWCPRTGAHGALLYCHGNGGNLSYRHLIYRSLQEEQNVSVLAFDYPGYGRSGGKPNEAQCYAAAEAAFDWLTSTGGVPAEQVLLYGESLGGGVVVDLATRRPCRALILQSTFTTLPDVAKVHYPYLPTHQLMRNRFENVRKLPGIARPVFVAHGDADTLIPPSHAQRLVESAGGPAELYLEPWADHEMELTPAFHAALRAFLKRHAPI